MDTNNPIVFEQTGDFEALNAATKWCSENGYSVGSLARGFPVGLKRGDWSIAKWYNLNAEERRGLDGRMVSNNFRNGPVTVIVGAGDQQ